MRRLLLTAVLLVALVPGAIAATPKPLLGVTADAARFQRLTGQQSTAHLAFLSWEQGWTWGATLRNFFRRLAPVPVIHLTTKARPPNSAREAITPVQISLGLGDDYLIAINNAISDWGRLVYVRPLAEMNNPANIYSYEHSPDADHSPAIYQRAFCRIYLILHGGPVAAVDARLRALGMPPIAGGNLLVNPYPKVLRVIWNPHAASEHRAGPPAARYYPGDGCVDVVGNDMFSSAWDTNESLYNAHPGKPYAFPEWGLEGVDSPGFVEQMCQFVRTHSRVELLAYYNSSPGSIYDLGDKPRSAAAYRRCLTPMGGTPVGLGPVPGPATIAPPLPRQLRIAPAPAGGNTPLGVTFTLSAGLPKPVVQWQLVFGDGNVAGGTGPPPATLAHNYTADGIYQATLIVFTGPPFTGPVIRWLTSTTVEVGAQPEAPLVLQPNPSSGGSPLKVVFRAITRTPRPVVRWELLFGDGRMNSGTGKPGNFFGHTYQELGTYRAVLITYLGAAARVVTYADVRVG